MAIAKQMLDLNDAHDIINEDTDLEQVLAYVEGLQSSSMLENCTLNTIQSLSSSMNKCLHSKKANGKLNGLVVLQFLVQDCSDEIFNESGSNWIKVILPMLQKIQVSEGALRLICSILRILVKKAPQYPDISRHLTTVVSPMIDALVAVTQKFGHLLNECLSTICTIFKTYPGSCGSSVSNVENLLLSNIKPDSKLSSDILAKCLSLIPRLGGGGKEGMTHKANFVNMFQKLSFTLEDLLSKFFELSFINSKKSVNFQRTDEPFLLPFPESTDMLKKSLYMQKQFAVVSDCLCALIKVPFPHYKSIRLGLILCILKKLFDQMSLSECGKMVGNEGKVLLLVLPSLMISSLKILRELILTCRKSVILIIPGIMDIVLTVLADLRNFTESFSDLKIQVYKLISDICDVVGANDSLEKCHKDLVSYVLSDVLPQKMPSTSVISQPNKKKKSTASFVPTKTSVCKMNQELIRVALSTLTSILKAMGSIMDESVHKQVQSVLISLGMEQDCCSIACI